jgi:hypothetical protein
MPRFLLLLPLVLALAACGGGHDGTVTYQVYLKPGKVVGTTIADDRHIDPADAQWSAFLAQARDTLGEAPSRFEVRAVRLQLDVTKSKNVGALQEVVQGEVTTFLRASNTGTQVDIARVENPKGSAQVPMSPTGRSLEPLAGELAQGDFRLGLRGNTPQTSGSDFEGVVTVTVDVTAR